MSYVVKRRLKLKSRYKQRVEAAIEYAKSIDDLVDPRTLALYCLGPEPFAFVLCAIEIEEKKSKNFSSSLTLPLVFLFYFYFFKVFPFCRNDDQI